MSSSRLRWLHVSDFHFRRQGDTWEADRVLDALIEDVQSLEPPDFIVCTGDVAFSGKADEYRRAEEHLERLLEICRLGRDRLFVIPGNHDIDRKKKPLTYRGAVADLTTSSHINGFLGSATNRKDLAGRWSAFRTFASRLMGRGKAGAFGDAWRLDLAQATVTMAGVHSAWLCGQDGEEGRLAAGERQVRSLLSTQAGDGEADHQERPRIVLGLIHHPFESLMPEDRRTVEALLMANCQFILHGHLHFTDLQFRRGPDSSALVIAAGAAYESRTTRNAYNLVDLEVGDLSGTVFLRAYTPDRGGFFAPDTQTFRSAPSGRVEFPPPAEHPRPRRGSRQSPGPDPWAAVRSYCRHLSESFSSLKLFAPEGSRDQPAGLAPASTLGGSFIPLHLSRFQEDTASNPLEIEDVFFRSETNRHCLVRGLPGSGKTTLLRYLAYRYAQGTAEGKSNRVPVYIQLKNANYRGSRPVDLEWLLAFLREEIDGQVDNLELAGFLVADDRLREGQLELLLDGLDEVEGSTLQHLITALSDLRRHYPRCPAVVTSRPTALQGFRFPRYEQLELLPLQEEMIESYLARRFTGRPAAAGRLQTLFQRHSRIGSLARNPFLLSMICSTHETLGHLETIQSRSELYELCTSHLIQRLYEPEGAHPLLSYEDTLTILKDLSLRFFLWQEPDFPVSYVNVLASRTVPADVIGRTEEFLDEFQRASGLIQRSRSGYSFVHRSLWEYFTALALLDRRPEFLLRQAANPDWDEVVRLYAGLSMARGSFPRELVEGLWLINKPLCLRVTSEIRAAVPMIQSLINASKGNADKLLLIDSLEHSVHLMPPGDRVRTILETLRILLFDCEERDCEVLFRAQQLLERWHLEPLAPGGLLYELFDLGQAEDRLESLTRDPETHLEWIAVEGGTFWMGEDDQGWNERPAHRVAVETFFMSKHPATNRLVSLFPFARLSFEEDEGNLPAVTVNWYEAYYFSLWIGCRLPKEREWEYAARGGRFAQRTLYFFGNDLSELADHVWYGERNRSKPHPVDEINPRTGRENLNPLGLSNILGNVWEWCEDSYVDYLAGNNGEPGSAQRLKLVKDERSLRGGTFRGSEDSVRCGRRVFANPANRESIVGFRLVRPCR